jgi:membrane-bound lytic murein transglycosylase MltF
MIRAALFLGLLFWKFGLFAKGTDMVIGYPTNYDALFKAYASKHKIDWLILKRIAIIESNLGRAKSVAHGLQNPSDVEGSKSFDGKSWGLMQVTLTTAQWLDPSATVAKLNSPTYSVELAAKYLRYLFDFFPSTDARLIEWVVKSYNQGQGNTAKERNGTGQGFAHDYWAKYKNLQTKVVS